MALKGKWLVESMIVGIGTDIIEVERIRKACERPRFLSRVFTERELAFFQSRKENYQVLAGNFAAKEAVVKAMGTGFRGFAWKDVEILRDELGKPHVVLHRQALKTVRAMDGKRIHVSISHTQCYAVAQAILEG